MEDKLQLVRSSRKMPILARHNSGGLMKKRKLAKHNNNSGGLFSEDIMTEIFLWLPLKSLIRFKRLSKRWYFLISDKDNSYFRRNYLSTFSSTRGRRNRIVGSDDNSSAIMAGFFSFKPLPFWKSNEPVRFLPSTSTQFKKYSFLPSQGGGGGGGGGESSKTTTSSSATEIIIINKMNPFLSFEESLDKFLSARLHEDEESYPLIEYRKIFVAASSNGFLLCTLYSRFSHITDYLVNPVTMEWLALPKLEPPVKTVYIGFVCKGDYPSLDLVEYTIVRLSWLEEGKVNLLFQLLSSTNNEWIEYRVSCESLAEFDLCQQHNTMIVSTTTNNIGGSGGSSRILVYFLVRVRLTRATAIVVIDLNEEDASLQMFETPAPDHGRTGFYGADYIREFDDGVIHYVRFFCSTGFEFWVFNTHSGEWYLKHKASLYMMLSVDYNYSPKSIFKWTDTRACCHIHAFHPMNPNLMFLTFYGKFACYNVESGIFEVVYDFDAQNVKYDYRSKKNKNVKYDYSHFVYQWPCWPPLL